ncbi:MAG: DUF3987 domain-containing protein [Chlorobiales bacterium]|nr:DUF3987 domain-containing protein [Chlorobiales bacterium]
MSGVTMSEGSDVGAAMPLATRLQEARRIEQLRYFELPQFPVRAVPDDFFTPVLEYLQTMTDAPKEFLFSSMLMTVGAVIGNRVAMQVGSQMVKPNLYGLCLAGSTVGRKTTAVSFCTRYLEMTQEALKEEMVNLRMPDSGSHEGLIECMREPRLLTRYEGSGANRVLVEEMEKKVVVNSGIASFSEFAGFMDNLRKDYNKGMESFILDVYDGNCHTRQLKNEQSRILNPCLSIFGASTLTQFLQRITENDKHSGFLQRIFYCYVSEQRGKLRSLIENSAPDDGMEALIVASLVKIYRVAATIERDEVKVRLSGEARVVYQESYQRELEEIAVIKKGDAEFSGVLLGYHGRLDMMKFKVAMIYAVVEVAGQNMVLDRRNGLFISGDVMKGAVRLITYFWHTTGYLLRHQFKFTPYEQRMKRIVEMLKKQDGKMNRRELLQRTGWPAKEFDEVLATGMESGTLTLVEEKQPTGQSAKFIYLELRK